ncbi:hypothetical protein OW763_13810 [Clostridium aestuarii]|uniref:DUF304 domain-containing protein n=1 Tax=Clostridium aestuarii TaxID=338193 RepID=A0ABT4D432_9CLOT|nr:hypothetical protein [Clostridium aestuarii]MCY6485407.1 hypothetical protein [Clostridium aestuarii]
MLDFKFKKSNALILLGIGFLCIDTLSVLFILNLNISITRCFISISTTLMSIFALLYCIIILFVGLEFVNYHKISYVKTNENEIKIRINMFYKKIFKLTEINKALMLNNSLYLTYNTKNNVKIYLENLTPEDILILIDEISKITVIKKV